MNVVWNAETFLIVIGGIVIGWILSFIRSFFTIKKHKKELKDYQDHLERQMKITDAGNRTLIEEMTTLKKDNENLRISVKTLGQKPGRAELRLLNVYDKALRKMMLQAPGFSSAWETSLQEAESEYEENETGLKSIVGKVFGSSGTNTSVESSIRRIEHNK